ncbi:hypothetical protein C475_00025 [Halosimplex carlsbadense 2-9-1]|uniref:Lipoprotein n=1 Tax=Halosimplex carlsbadense 2-9-1 TaxID=797114 RepID=M0D6M9_9EURY|nr:hypothetical protein [Halosimplex carlsbadense]ELZ30483.1 hypothetical protein C475_00025 [Halosimplex carlsbadense 2-9-1]
MHRRTVVVALLVVLAGCNAFAGGNDTDRSETATLTPVEVPTAESLRTATPTATECLAPRVAADDRTPAPTPTTPVTLATTDGTVTGGDIVAGHGAALDNHSFSLRMDGTRVRAMPGASAFTYEGVTLGFRSVRVYAVAGTIYRLRQVEDGVAVARQPYDSDSPGSAWYRDALTGENWLDERIGDYNYTQVGTRTWNGTEVRVFEEARDIEVLVGSGEALRVESTVLVDRRGIVRHVRQVRTLKRDTIDGIVNTTEVETFTVGEVGTVTVSRPDAFCVPGSEAVTISTPRTNATAAGTESARSTTGAATTGPPTAADTAASSTTG